MLQRRWHGRYHGQAQKSVVAGFGHRRSLDQGAPLQMSEIMSNEIAGAQLVVLEDASHIAVVEQPEAFAQAVQQFLNKQG